MEKEEIKDYLKKIYELEAKLTGEDKETYTLLIYGYNQCAKLLNETEQQCKKQKEVIDKAIKDAMPSHKPGANTTQKSGFDSDQKAKYGFEKFK